MSIAIYLRISTSKQDTDNQRGAKGRDKRPGLAAGLDWLLHIIGNYYV